MEHQIQPNSRPADRLPAPAQTICNGDRLTWLNDHAFLQIIRLVTVAAIADFMLEGRRVWRVWSGTNVAIQYLSPMPSHPPVLSNFADRHPAGQSNRPRSMFHQRPDRPLVENEETWISSVCCFADTTVRKQGDSLIRGR